MSTDLIPFEFRGNSVRVTTIGGEPWFVAADVCAVLGYRNSRDAIAKHVRDSHRGVSRIATPSGEQDMTVLSEPGLYRLMMRSNAPLADQFQDWVTDEVLPAIRKTGRYEVRPPQHEIPQTLADALEFAAKKVRALEAAEARNAELEPDAARARRTIDADGLALVGTVAKRFGIKSKALREFLYAEGLLIRRGNRHNEPYARYIESGHFELKTRLVDVDPDRAPQERSTTFVTPKGEALIWKRLYDAGYVTSPTQPPRQLQLVGIDGGAA